MIQSILIATGFITITGLILALLLVLAERRILNYGECKISINNGEKELVVQGGATLLASLAENDIFIPSACGGRGSCAYCKLKVLAGGGVISPVEEPYLSDEERISGVRLSCQVKVRNDLQIEIPKELFSVRRFSGIIEYKKPLTYDIIELRIRLKQPESIDFVAGQYIQLESAEYKGRESVMRAYSIASVPADNRSIDLNIRLVPDGICTTWVFEVLKEGQAVHFSGPYGEFRLSDTDAPIICIAGGSGMAPIWSIIRDMKDRKIERETTYFFGARSQADLFYLEELRRLEKVLPWFTFIPALSAEPENSDWKGERGLITDVVSRHFPDCSRHEAYLCGSPGMIDACVAVLTKAGMPEDKILYDKFT